MIKVYHDSLKQPIPLYRLYTPSLQITYESLTKQRNNFTSAVPLQCKLKGNSYSANKNNLSAANPNFLGRPKDFKKKFSSLEQRKRDLILLHKIKYEQFILEQLEEEHLNSIVKGQNKSLPIVKFERNLNSVGPQARLNNNLSESVDNNNITSVNSNFVFYKSPANKLRYIIINSVPLSKSCQFYADQSKIRASVSYHQSILNKEYQTSLNRASAIEIIADRAGVATDRSVQSDLNRPDIEGGAELLLNNKEKRKLSDFSSGRFIKLSDPSKHRRKVGEPEKKKRKRSILIIDNNSSYERNVAIASSRSFQQEQKQLQQTNRRRVEYPLKKSDNNKCRLYTETDIRYLVNKMERNQQQQQQTQQIHNNNSSQYQSQNHQKQQNSPSNNGLEINIPNSPAREANNLIKSMMPTNNNTSLDGGDTRIIQQQQQQLNSGAGSFGRTSSSSQHQQQKALSNQTIEDTQRQLVMMQNQQQLNRRSAINPVNNNISAAPSPQLQTTFVPTAPTANYCATNSQFPASQHHKYVSSYQVNSESAGKASNSMSSSDHSYMLKQLSLRKEMGKSATQQQQQRDSEGNYLLISGNNRVGLLRDMETDREHASPHRKEADGRRINFSCDQMTGSEWDGGMSAADRTGGESSGSRFGLVRAKLGDSCCSGDGKFKKARMTNSDENRGIVDLNLNLVKAFKRFAMRKTDMNNPEFMKWVKDANVLGNKMDSNHVDIAFFKCKQKGLNSISLKELEAMIFEMATKYREDNWMELGEAIHDLKLKLASAYKIHTGQKPLNMGIVERLTDTRLFTGVYKEWFDENGKPRLTDRNILYSGYPFGFKANKNQWYSNRKSQNSFNHTLAAGQARK